MTSTTTGVQGRHDSGADDAAYSEKLQILSNGSVHRRFEPYVDIDWDSPDFAIDSKDPRWILPAKADAMGGHPWYQALPDDQKIAIGMWRQANIAKVGLQFENVLIRGMMQHVFALPNGSPEFRYCTHEVIEECNHTMMFQEVVNRIGQDTPGMGRLIRTVLPAIPLVAMVFPEWFFVMVLGGEEPIDHSQKTILRAGADVHPMMERVMTIHVAEEARHISFAHEYLRHRVPKMSKLGRFALSIVFPITMRVACNLIAVPPRSFRKKFDIPKSVLKDLYWRSPEARKMLRDFFSDVRMLADEIGVMNPVSRVIWKICRIDGDSSRYRSEPVRTSARAA